MHLRTENLTNREVNNECKCSLVTYSLCVLQFPRFFIQTTEMITLVVLHGIRTASYQNGIIYNSSPHSCRMQ